MKYLLVYASSNRKLIGDYVEFYAMQLNYAELNGRISAMEMLTAVFSRLRKVY